MDRVAFVVATGKGTGFEGGQGTLDRDAVSERLALGDAGFDVHALSLSEDLASQLDAWVARFGVEVGAPQGERTGPPPSAVVFYASSRVLLAEATPLLLLDADDPGQGDAIADVLDVLADFAAENLLVLLDLRCEPTADALEIVDKVRALVKGLGTTAELIVGVRPLALEDEVQAEAPSPFTRAILEALDAADPAEGLYAIELYERVRESERIAGVVNALAYAGRDDSLALLLVTEDAEPPVEVSADASYPPPDARVDAEGAGTAALPEMAPPPPPEEDDEDDVATLSPPPAADLPPPPSRPPAAPPPASMPPA
ncbi:MAG TPA: hypothetical protein VL400_18875, partial [Polyangiaceae bacterium]|nr:hypothetical protein [Polyangiaceae bacterium]